jgi:hypothetical protein
MIIVTIDGLCYEYAKKLLSDVFPKQSMTKIKCDVRRYSSRGQGNPTTLGLGCLWSGRRIREFDKNMFYKVSDENRPVEWKLKNGKDLDLIFNHFKNPKFYEKVAGPSPYHNYETYQKEYNNIPAKKVECEEYCIFNETAKRDYDLFWIHTSIIKTGVLMPGPYEQGRIPSVIPYDKIRRDKPLKKKVYEFGINRYKQAIKYLQELAEPNETFIISSDHGTMVDVPFNPKQIDEIPLIINKDIDLKNINYQWDLKDFILSQKEK